MIKKSFSMGLVVFVFFACSQQKQSDIEGLREEIVRSAQAFEAEIGLVFKDLESGEILKINERESMHAASTMKVPVLIEVFKQAGEGSFSLVDTLTVRNEFRSIVDGSPYVMEAAGDSDEDIYSSIGEEKTIRELVNRMITVSSNLATNMLIELVGAENVMKTLEKLGANSMQVLRGVEDIKAFELGLNNRTDAYDLMLVMEAIATGNAGTPQDCEDMIRILSRQEFREKIPAGLPEGIQVANKTGSITEIDHDAAIVFPPERKPYILVVLTRGVADRLQAQELLAGLSHLIYAHVTGQK